MTRRLDRVNGLLRQELALVIAQDMRDPRLPLLVSITRVETATDLTVARVFVSVVGSDEERASALRMLRSAAGFLRRQLAARVTLRRMPLLEFQLDDSIQEGAHVLSVMDGLRSEEPR